MTPPIPAGKATGYSKPETGKGHEGLQRGGDPHVAYDSYAPRLLALANEPNSHLMGGAAGQGGVKAAPGTIDVLLLTLNAGPAGYSELGAALPLQRRPYLFDAMNTLVRGLGWVERASPAEQGLQVFRLTPEGQQQADKLLGKPDACPAEAPPTQAWMQQYQDVMTTMAGVVAAFFSAPMVGAARAQPEPPQLRQPPSPSGPV